MSGRKVLITVGTTEFDALTQVIDSQAFMEMLKECGYGRESVTFQIGHGKYQPENGECFRLSPNIAQIYADHYVVFCHGGAGTLLACLKDLPNKRIIAVANPTLADNHQIQLLTQLQKDNLLLAFNSPHQLLSGIESVRNWITNPAPPSQSLPSNKPVLNHLIFGDNL